jgi:hypothetical protein
MAPINPFIANMPYAPATVLHSTTNQPPLLSSRSITIANLRKFDYACKCFFVNKEIPAKDQVGRIIYSFESEFMQSWIESDSEHLVGLSFPEFILEVKCKWLPMDWEDELIQELIAYQGDREFYEWSISLCKANNELEAAGSLQHIPNEHFHAHLIAHLNPALRLAYCTSKAEFAVEDIEAWIHRIVILDIQHATHQKQIFTSMAHTAKTAARLQSSKGAYMQSNIVNAHTSNNSSGSTAASNIPALLVSFVAIPKLTQLEKDLLDIHQGCYKCRQFYAEHFSRTCNNERPSLDACKKVTSAHAL